MATRRKKGQEPPPAEEQTQGTAEKQEPTAPETEGGPTLPELPPPGRVIHKLPQVGDQMHYYDRDTFVRDIEADRKPTPHAATVTGIEYLKENPDEGLLNIAQFHPSEGLIVRRHVRIADRPEPGCVCWKASTVIVPMHQLAEAARMAIEQMVHDQRELDNENKSGEPPAPGSVPHAGGKPDDAAT